MKLTPEEKKLLERMLKAFKHYNCFIYGKEEHEKVRGLLEETGLMAKVWIGYVDPRYPHIYIVKPRSRDLERECIIEIENLFRSGSIRREDYLKMRDEMIKQCINHYTYERGKEIISIMEELIKGGRSEDRRVPEISLDGL